MTAVAEPMTVEQRLERLTAQVDQIAADLRDQRQWRSQREELAQALVPVARGAFDVANRELEELSGEVTIDDAVRLARTLARSLPQLERLVAQLQSMAELGTEVSSLSGAGVSKLSQVLAEADRKGYFVVARGSATVLDRLVASAAEEDFEALGEGLVLLLGLARQAVDPAMLGLAERALNTVRDGQSAAAPPPSTLGLLRRLRDPQTRRGMARALDLLHELGADSTCDVTASTQ
jgi:uncharacterized protein YjgD (DUF1641 family)